MKDGPSYTFNSLLNKYKIPLGLFLIGFVLIIGGIFATSISTKSPTIHPKESIIDPATEYIAVDISGAVVKVGVYKVKVGARMEDIVDLAGGFSENANKEYISKYLNLAQKVSDGIKIYVPFEGEEGVIQGGLVSGASSSQVKININLASQSDLESLTGIGPATAQKIISGRPYEKIEDLLTKKIVGKATFDKLKDSIVTF